MCPTYDEMQASIDLVLLLFQESKQDRSIEEMGAIWVVTLLGAPKGGEVRVYQTVEKARPLKRFYAL